MANDDAPPDVASGGFTAGHLFVAGSRNAEVFELDASLAVVSRWTHPSFGVVMPAPGQDFGAGPAGMAFDAKGQLVVAGRGEFCVFSAPGVVVGCHPKHEAEATENLIMDLEGNIYTTTATGGTNAIRKYRADFTYVTTFSMPTNELTGVTCDPDGNLYVGAQGGGSRIYKVDKTTLTVMDTIPLSGSVEGLQYAAGATVLAADFAGGNRLRRVDAHSPTTVISTLDAPGLDGPVPVTIDNAGNVYAADFEDGGGTAPADLFVFAPDGTLLRSRRATEIFGPFGIVVAGTRLPCGAYQIL